MRSFANAPFTLILCFRKIKFHFRLTEEVEKQVILTKLEKP